MNGLSKAQLQGGGSGVWHNEADITATNTTGRVSE